MPEFRELLIDKQVAALKDCGKDYKKEKSWKFEKPKESLKKWLWPLKNKKNI